MVRNSYGKIFPLSSPDQNSQIFLWHLSELVNIFQKVQDIQESVIWIWPNVDLYVPVVCGETKISNRKHTS